MNDDEQVLLFGCGADTLVGVLSLPPRPATTAVVIVVGGPQYRAGSHRQFVLLARRLAQAGFAVLRFDLRGMGDSSGAMRGFESVSDDIGAALSACGRALPLVERFVLWGLCDGASAALMYAQGSRDTRVAGLCLANPWVRSEASLARTQVRHYYTRRVLQRDFWAKLASGGIGGSALRGLAGSLVRMLRGRSAAAGTATCQRPYQQAMADGWQGFDGPVLLLLSGQDYTAKEFLDHVSRDMHWRGALGRLNVLRHDLVEADHTFSNPISRRRVEALTLEWVGASWPGEPGTAGTGVSATGAVSGEREHALAGVLSDAPDTRRHPTTAAAACETTHRASASEVAGNDA